MEDKNVKVLKNNEHESSFDGNRINVPYIVHEGVMARFERTIMRLWVICIILIVFLVGTNVAWLYYESSFEEIEITRENDDGYNNYIGTDGDIIN